MSGVHGLLGLQAPNTLFRSPAAALALPSAPIQVYSPLQGAPRGRPKTTLSAANKKIQHSSTLDLESAAPAFPAMDNQGAPRIPHAFEHEALSQHAKLTTAFTSVSCQQVIRIILPPRWATVYGKVVTCRFAVLHS